MLGLIWTLYRLACQRGLSNETVIRSIVAFNNIPIAEQRCQQVIQEAYNLQIKKESLLADINFLKSEKSRLKAQISDLAKDIMQSEENLHRKTEEEQGIAQMMFKHQKAILSKIVAAVQTDKTSITMRPMPSLIQQEAIGDVAFEGGVQEVNEGDIAK
jgi:septal ring factor EnvC (AmiA/AmiB activator)